jgi:hypothetical protein
LKLKYIKNYPVDSFVVVAVVVAAVLSAIVVWGVGTVNNDSAAEL